MDDYDEVQYESDPGEWSSRIVFIALLLRHEDWDYFPESLLGSEVWSVEFGVSDEYGSLTHAPTNEFEHRTVLATVSAMLQELARERIVDAIQVVPTTPKLGSVYRRLFARAGWDLLELREGESFFEHYYAPRGRYPTARHAYIDESSALPFELRDWEGSYAKYLSDPMEDGWRVGLKAHRVDHQIDEEDLESGYYDEEDLPEEEPTWEVEFSVESPDGRRVVEPTNRFQHQAVLATVTAMMRDLLERADVDLIQVRPATEKLVRVYERLFERAGWTKEGWAEGELRQVYRRAFIDPGSALPFKVEKGDQPDTYDMVSEPLPGSNGERVRLSASQYYSVYDGRAVWQVEFMVSRYEFGDWEPTNAFQHQTVLATVVAMMHELMALDPTVDAVEVDPSNQALGRIYRKLFEREGFVPDSDGSGYGVDVYTRASRYAFIDSSSALPFQVERHLPGWSAAFLSEPMPGGSPVLLTAYHVRSDPEAGSGIWGVNFGTADETGEIGSDSYDATNQFQHRAVLATVVAMLEELEDLEKVDAVKLMATNEKLGRIYERLFERAGWELAEDDGLYQYYRNPKASRVAFIDSSSALPFRDVQGYQKWTFVSDPDLLDGHSVQLNAYMADWGDEDGWEVEFLILDDEGEAVDAMGGYDFYAPTNRFEHRTVLATVVAMLRRLEEMEDVEALLIVPSSDKLGRIYRKLLVREGWGQTNDTDSGMWQFERVE